VAGYKQAADADEIINVESTSSASPTSVIRNDSVSDQPVAAAGRCAAAVRAPEAHIGSQVHTAASAALDADAAAGDCRLRHLCTVELAAFQGHSVDEADCKMDAML